MEPEDSKGKTIGRWCYTVSGQVFKRPPSHKVQDRTGLPKREIFRFLRSYVRNGSEGELVASRAETYTILMKEQQREERLRVHREKLDRYWAASPAEQRAIDRAEREEQLRRRLEPGWWYLNFVWTKRQFSERYIYLVLIAKKSILGCCSEFDQGLTFHIFTL